MIARATESDAPFARIAERYDVREPRNRTETIVCSTASTRASATGCPGVSTSRAKSALSATWGSPVTRCQRLHAELRDRLAVDAAARVRRQRDLSFVARRVEAGPGRRLPVAESRIARPQRDAGGLRLVGVRAGRVEGPPAPRDDAADAKLAGHLLRRERHELREPKPGGGRLEPLATSLTRPRLETYDEPEAVWRDPGGQQRRETLTELLAHRATREHGARAHERRRREVHLAGDLRDLPYLLPPGERVATDVRTRGDEQERPSAAGRDAPEHLEHVRAVLRVRRRPRVVEPAPLSSLRTMTGVWHSVAAIALSTISVTPAATVAASVGADGVPATRLSFIHQYTVWAPARPELPRVDGAGGRSDNARPSEDVVPERHGALGVLDPQGSVIRQAAQPSQRSRRGLAEAQSRAQRDDDDGELRHGAKG